VNGNQIRQPHFSRTSGRGKWAVLVTVMVGVFMAIIDGSIVNVALPHMATTFATNTDRIRWVVEAYAMSYAIATLTMTWLRERVGIKVTFISGLVLFTASSALCAISWDLGSMVAFRIIQGIGGGVMLPAGFTLITESFPPHQRGTAFGFFGIVIVFAPTVGPTLGGYLTDSVGWPYIFYINIPVGILTFLLSTITLAETKKLRPISFDFWGFIGLAAFLACLLTVLTNGQREGWNSDYSLSLFGFSLLGLLLFLLVSPRRKSPIFDLKLFRNFHFSMIAILNLSRASAMFGRIFLLPLFFQNMLGYSATTTGFLLAPGALVSGIVAPITGPLVDRYGPKFFIFAGLIITAVANFMYYKLDVRTSYVDILIPTVIFGFGMGMLNTPITATAMNVVRREQISQVSTVLSVIMQVGGAFGVALLGTAMNNRAAFHQAVYAENVSAYSHTTQSALEGIQHASQSLGAPSFQASAQAPVFLGKIVAEHATTAGYQDAFILTGIITLLAVIPALGLLNVKSPKRPDATG
jgi:DHA2 family multidrug resistance protein